MIQINVLPDRYRKSERTSPKLFAAMLLCVVFVSGSLGWLGLAYFGDLGELEVELSQLEETVASRQDSVTRHSQLGKERADYQQREQTIREIAESRMIWTPVVDELVEIASSADEERHTVWFKSMSISSPTSGKKKEGPKILIPGSVSGSSLDNVVNLYEDLAAARFGMFVDSTSGLEAKSADDAERTPRDSRTFTYEIRFQNAKTRSQTLKAR
ncbi:MAG: hypothetical protein AAF196_19865 [Planctomycetota bacterium]